MYIGENASSMIHGFRGASEGGKIGWTPRKADVGFYGVTVNDIKVNGVSIGVSPSIYNKGDAIVDSGTSDVCLPHSAFEALKEAFVSICTNGTACLKGICDCKTHKVLEKPIFEERCVQMTLKEREAYPMIEVEFEGGLVVPHPPSSYLRNDTIFCDEDYWTIAIESEGRDGSGTIFGDTFMQGFNVIHDRRHPQRIGFAKVANGECP